MPEIQGFHLVDDTFRADPGSEHGTGYEPRDYASFPLNGMAHNRAATIKRLSMKEIIERIKEKNANKSWVKDHCDRVGLGVKNQRSSSYCWIHAPVRGMECKRVMSGGTVLTLSAFYAGSRIKGGRNQGGSGVQGVEWLAKHGTCLESMWEPMKFSGQVTPEIEASAMSHQISIFEELDPSDHELIYSSVVQDDPITVGIPVWTHEVLLTFLVEENGYVYPGIDNSWGASYGTNGRSVLHGAYTRFDEAGRIAAMEMSVS